MYYHTIKHPNKPDVVETFETVHEMLGITEAEFNEMKATEIRLDREHILTQEIDPIVSNPLRWGSLSDEQQLAYTVYRQNLLDITEQEGFPHDVVWPTKPEV